MIYPEEFVRAVVAHQKAVDGCNVLVKELGIKLLDMGESLEDEKKRLGKGENRFQEFLLPLCFFIKSKFGVWIKVLGGSEQKFIALEKSIEALEKTKAKTKEEFDEAMEKRREAEKDFYAVVDRYLRLESLVFKKRSEVAEAIRKIEDIAEPFYKQATDIRCDLIGLRKPEEFEEIRAAGMEKMLVLLPKAIEGLSSLEKYVTEDAGDELIESFGEWFSSLLDQLRSCSLESKNMEDTKNELDVILGIMRRMTNGTRNSDTDIEKWVEKRIKQVGRAVLKEAAES